MGFFFLLYGFRNSFDSSKNLILPSRGIPLIETSWISSDTLKFLKIPSISSEKEKREEKKNCSREFSHFLRYTLQESNKKKFEALVWKGIRIKTRLGSAFDERAKLKLRQDKKYFNWFLKKVVAEGKERYGGNNRNKGVLLVISRHFPLEEGESPSLSLSLSWERESVTISLDQRGREEKKTVGVLTFRDVKERDKNVPWPWYW